MFLAVFPCSAMTLLMRYGPNEELKHSTNYLTPNDEEIIEVKETLKDLGVIMSDKATFTERIKHVCLKVKQKSGWILPTCHSRDTKFLKFMWKSLVQDHIDYCSQLYMPNKKSEMQNIENLQRWFTKKNPRS